MGADSPAKLDVVLHEAGAGDAYHAARSPFAIALAPPTSAAAVQGLAAGRALIENSLVNNGALTQQQLESFGAELAKVLFSGDVGALYAACRKQNGARVTLCMDGVALKSIPWEFVRWPDVGVAPHGQRTLARLCPVNDDSSIEPVALRNEPMVVLLAVSDPTNLSQVDWQETKAKMDEVFAENKKHVSLEVVEAASAAAVATEVKRLDPHVVHFIGHGQANGLLFTNRSTGKSKLVTSSQLHGVFGGDRVRLVILSACDTGKNTDAVTPLANLAEQLVRAGICAVVANQMPITLRSVATFCNGLYRELLDSGNIDLAVNQGRVDVGYEFDAIDAAVLEWGIPVLYRRPGCDLLFDTGGS
ncbi:MAG: CHAT domain-containing protein [Hyphomonadaceae bacterium]|nr:CHAT domain-containing protein [Hyphomonadaceae bacterium]